MIRRRLTLSVALAVAVALGAGCGSEQTAAPAPPEKTPQQVGAAQLLQEYEATPGCGCTGETRAKDRAATLFTYAGTGLVATTR